MCPQQLAFNEPAKDQELEENQEAIVGHLASVGQTWWNKDSAAPISASPVLDCN